MAVYKSNHAKGIAPVASLFSALVMGILMEYTTEANAAAGDIFVMGNLEPGVKPVSARLIVDDLDTNGAPTVTLSVGILNAAGTDIDAAATSTWIAASTVGQTGGEVATTTPNCYLSGKSTAMRQVCVKVVAGAATGVGAGKKVAVVLNAAS